MPSAGSIVRRRSGRSTPSGLDARGRAGGQLGAAGGQTVPAMTDTDRRFNGGGRSVSGATDSLLQFRQQGR